MYMERNYVYISKLESDCCPVAVLLRYIHAADIDLCSQLPLRRPLRKKFGYTLRNDKLPFIRCRKISKDPLKDVGLHSLRFDGGNLCCQ